MGSGKTVIGHRLARELKMTYLDTDQLIEEHEQMTINQIFAEKDEGFFRGLETSALKSLHDYDNFVIATGGGIVLREENVKMLKRLGPLILLWANPAVIYERIKSHKNRPLLDVADPKQEIRGMLEVRTPTYERVADFKVDTSKLSIDETITGIMQWLKSR